MAILSEGTDWTEGIYQLEETDPVQGGPDGIDNLQAKQLAARTQFLKALCEGLGSGKQPLDATLTALAAISTAANKLIYATGVDTFAVTDLTAFARSLLDDVDAAAARTTLGAAPSTHVGAGGAQHPAATTSEAGFMSAADKSKLDGIAPGAQPNAVTSVAGRTGAISLSVGDVAGAAPSSSPSFTGTPTAPTQAAGNNSTRLATTAFVQAAVSAIAEAQPLDATLTALAAISTAANKLIYATGVDTFAVTDFTSFARTLLDDADAAAARTTLGAAPSSHVGAGGSQHPAASTTVDGFMSAADKSKLDGIAPGAQVNVCRAWVNFNGSGVVAIKASGNVSSITDNGVGDYTINFATAMPDENYAASSFVSGYSDGGQALYVVAYKPQTGGYGTPPLTKTVSAARIMVGQGYGNSYHDVPDISVSFYR